MKKLLTLLVLVFLASGITRAGVADGIFSQFSGTYTETSGGTVIQAQPFDDTMIPNIAIGFTFNANGINFTTMNVNPNGYVFFHPTSTTSLYSSPLSSTGVATMVASAMARDIQSTATSAIRVETTGTAPNRVTTIQWNDVKRYGSSYDGELMDFQIKLYETTNAIEFVYGPMTVSAYATSQFQVGLRGTANTDFNNRTTTTDWAASIAGATNSATMDLSTTVFPTSGLTFRYTVPAPQVAIYNAPVNGATGLPITTILNWSAPTTGGAPTGYRVYLGTDNPPTNVANGVDVGMATTYDPNPDLLYASTYYWQIVPYNGTGSATGSPVWSFSTSLGIGALQGYITNAFGIPLGGATVTLGNSLGSVSTTSAPDGSYSFSDVPAADYTVSATKTGYNTSSAAIFVAPEVITYQNLALTAPSMAVTPNPYNVTVNPFELYEGAFNIINNGSGPLGWEAEIVYPDRAPRADYPIYSNPSNVEVVSSPNRVPAGTRPQPGSLQQELRDPSDIAYAYVAYALGGLSEAPCTFALNTPGTVTNFGSAAADFIAAADWANDTWYGVVYGGQFLTINPETGAYTNIGTTGDFVGISFNHQNGVMYGLTYAGALMTINLETGATTNVGSSTSGFIAFEIDNDGIAYAVNIDSDQFGTINLETGAWTTIGPVGFNASYAQDMSCDHSTNELYWAAYDAGSSQGKLLLVNKETGTSQLIGTFPGGSEIDGFAIPGAAGAGAWLTLGNYTGTVNPYSTLSLPAYFNANNTEPGEVYTATVVFTSTPDVGTVSIPVTMTIAGDPLAAPDDLIAVLSNPITGQVSLSWTAPPAGYTNFVIKRDGATVGTTTGTTFTNILPAYGIYNFTVQAVYPQGNSLPAGPEEVEWPNPTLVLNPTALYNEQYPASSENVTLRVSNTGEGTLAFSFPAFAARQLVNSPDFTPNVPSTVQAVEVAKGETDPTDGAGNRNLRGAGGPDAYGYVWIDSDETGGPAYTWTDISSTGTLITGFTDDNVLGPYNLGFNFPFYENFYNTVNVSSNGYLIFGSTSSAYTNQNIPSSTAPNNIIAWFWNDLTGGGTVHYQNMGDRWIIQYTNYPDLSGTGTITAQVHLFPNGNIRIYYNNITSGLTINSSTIGIENNAGTVATNINYNANYVHNGLAIAIDFPVPSFITNVTPASGQVAAGEYLDVAVEFTADPIYHTVGTYTDELEINTNDVANASVLIPATMVVYNPGMISGTVTSAVDGSPIEAALVVAGDYSALTDANGNYSMILDAGTYTVTFSKTGFTSVTVNNVVISETVTTDLDAVLEEEFYPVTFVHAEVNEADTQTEVTWGLPSPEYEMFYDDGVAENFTAWALPGNMNAVKFTPAGYPATVYGGKIFIGDGSFPNNNNGLIGTTFAALVKADDGANGLPGTTLDSIIVTVNNYGWVEFTGLNAEIESGSFYLVMLQTAVSPNTAGVGIDQTTPIAYRSYSLNFVAGGTWALSPYQDMMMHALVSGPAGDNVAKVSSEVRVPKKQRGMISLTPPTAQSGAEGVAEYRAIQNGQTSREVTNYTIWRIAVTNPDLGPEAGTQTELTSVNATNYTDAAFQNLPMGWYAYAVAANYTNGGQSAKAYSNIVGHLKSVDVTVNVTLTTGGSPAGAVVTLTGADYPHLVLTQTVPEEGTVVFEDMAKGNYELFATKVGFDDYVFNANIQSDRTFDIMLAERKYKPRNLYVDPLTLVATWDEPLAYAVLEDFEGTTFPPTGWQVITQNTTGWYATTDGSSGSWTIPAHTKYAVVNDDADNGNGCCDYLITNELDFTNLDSYRLNFASFYDGAFGQSAYVELSTDNGANWTVINTLAPATAWTDIEIDLAQYSGANGLSSVWIAFHSDDNGEWASGWAIDDVAISSGGVPLQGYGVFLDGTLVGNTMERTFTYTNLNYGQDYLAGVAALFTSGYSELDTYLFKSLYLAPPDSLQGESPAQTDYVHLTWNEPVSSGGGAGGTLIEDFEAGTLPEGWLSIDEDGDGYKWDNSAVEFDVFDAHTGAYCMASASYRNDVGALNPNNWLITPAIQIGSQSELRFWVDAQDPAYAAEQYYVRVSTTGTDIEDFTETIHSAVSTGEWQEVVLDLGQFAGNQIYIAFVHADVTDMYFLKIDDVSIANATGMWPETTPVQPGISNAMPFRTSGMTTDQINSTLAQYNASVVKTPVRSVPGISGYNIYRDSEMVAFVDHPTTEYFDLNLDPGTYTYHITAVYDLTPYGFPFQTGESMIEGPIDVEVIYGFELPFVEDFTTGVFSTNDWSTDGTNWQIAGQQGNPMPSAMFSYSPAQQDYSLSMSSSWMIGAGFVDGKIYVDFDVKLDDNTATGDEKMLVEVYDGNAWTTFATITADGDTDWETKHVDVTSSAKGVVFRVRFTAVGLNSLDINNWLIDNVHIYRVCEAPTNLEASVPDPGAHGDQILLTWEGPDIPQPVAEWILWDDGVNYSGIGVGADATWAAAVRFTPTELAQYAGAQLTKIRFVPSEAAGSTFVLKVWTGANAANLVLSQPVSSFIAGTWNEYTLNTPVTISGTTELWFGYEVTQAAADFPGGTDNGPAINQYGNWANLDGVWETLVALNPALNYNWNIQGFVQTPAGAALPALPIADNTVYNAQGTLSMSSTTYVNGAVAPETGSREFTGYNVYRDDELIANTTETEYLDTDPEISVLNQQYCYKVSAVYTDCESEFSNTACATVVKVDDPEMSAVSIYPNPSNSVVNIELTNEISHLVIYNSVGQVVNEMNIAKDKMIQIDVRSYESGAYLVKFITNNGESFTKKLAVTR
ncbi:MAG TPA: choice-of-anchor J domain-containing protein [Lentimicrobium sp.]|nr:choice-of-anchor J domain-containing protein [Lentimicrobium sp.]